MRISDWSSDVCSSDLRLRGSRAVRGDMGPSGLQRPPRLAGRSADGGYPRLLRNHAPPCGRGADVGRAISVRADAGRRRASLSPRPRARACVDGDRDPRLGPRALRALSRQAHRDRSEEHTSELQSLLCNSYAVFCLKKKKNKILITLHLLHKNKKKSLKNSSQE